MGRIRVQVSLVVTAVHVLLMPAPAAACISRTWSPDWWASDISIRFFERAVVGCPGPLSPTVGSGLQPFAGVPMTGWTAAGMVYPVSQGKRPSGSGHTHCCRRTLAEP